MRDDLIREEYSFDKQYRYLIYKEEKYYEVWFQKRITDEYMGRTGLPILISVTINT